MNHIYICLTLMLGLAVQTVPATASDLSGLLQEVRRFSAADNAVNKEREQLFGSDVRQQETLLRQSVRRLENAETEQSRLKTLFDANDQKLAETEALIQQRSGQLGEVFGVAREKAGELRSVLDDSLTSAEYPQRSGTLAFADSKRVPTTEDLENLWYQLQLEMTASGEIKRFNSLVTANDGSSEMRSVVRFGLFGAATEQGDFLNWDVSQQTLTVLPTQPEDGAELLHEYLAEGGNVTLDPTRGQLFMLLDRAPKLMERVHQGGNVGYLILALGAAGLLVALLQMSMMLLNEMRVRNQLRNPAQLSPDNALGRVLLTVKAENLTPEQRELKVDEAILQELPALERGQSFVRLLAAVAPLLGLLGTVIGMIATFQSITLFGTSDPKLMAGGISQALMTTVLGLVVAIPLLFCHSYLAARGRRLTQILQERSLGLLAEAESPAVAEVTTRAA
ncbi:MAG: MotA/TolQ/ExbB proton channel family protein [Amphritea sp.]|nr:MotA/TolQ/ExbB proton channel family protein [Amphritea sp.]